MRCGSAVLIGLMLFAGPALARNPAPPRGGIATAPGGALVISSQICATLAGRESKVPGPDYRPGVDVNGHKVAPADLSSTDSFTGASSLPLENFAIEINRGLARRLNLPRGLRSKTIVGYVTMRDNRAYFNGRALDADQIAALAEACRAAGH